jgi:hypothetical protein
LGISLNDATCIRARIRWLGLGVTEIGLEVKELGVTELGLEVKELGLGFKKEGLAVMNKRGDLSK